MKFLLDVLDFLQPYGSHSYFVILGMLLACGFGIPMPEDIILITGGILSSHGVTDFWWVTGVCMVGVLGGDGTVFFLGRRYGARIRGHSFFRKLLSERRDHQVRGVIQKYGDKVVFMARFMPGLRTPIFFTCGSYHLSPLKFVLLDGAAAFISVPLWVYTGYLFGKNLDELERKMRQFQFGIYFVLGLIVLAFVAAALIKKRALKDVSAE